MSRMFVFFGMVGFDLFIMDYEFLCFYREY